MIAKYKWWIIGVAVAVIGFFAYRHFSKKKAGGSKPNIVPPVETETQAAADPKIAAALRSNSQINSILAN